MSADWLRNGHMVVLTQNGLVYDVDPATGAQRILLDITGKVNGAGEAGSLDVLVDPAGTGFYVYYAVKISDRLRISHFTAGSSVERVVWTNPGLGYNTANPYHIGGSLNTGPDGRLYLSIGDRVEGRSRDLTNVFGKVLRINPDGSIPSDNPFHDGAGPRVDEIWAYGLRNPYRASFDRTTGRYWVGDVGGNTDSQAYEEVDLVERGKDYGWPSCEGPLGPPKNGPSCPAGVTGPVFSYGHDIGAGCCQNRAIVGGEVYRGSSFPLAGYYVYADYPTDTFSWLQLGSDGRTAVSNGVLTTTKVRTPVWLGVGPDGAIYWLSLGWDGTGQLRRLSYTGETGRPPVITTAAAAPTTGTAPLAVRFTGSATDPDGTSVTYAWDFGDGTSSSAANPTHTYARSGTYRARLQVSSGGTTVSSNLITVTVGAKPTATISGPPDSTEFTAGQTFTISGSGHDPDTGPLAGSALSWDVRFLHNEHSHPAANGTGPSITLTVPRTGHDFAGETGYRVTLTATDPDGLTAPTSIVLRPRKAAVTVSSNQARSMTVDGVTQTLPHRIDTLVGFQHTVSVPSTTCTAGRLWTFSSWSDGGGRTHAVTVTPGLELAATYAGTTSTCGTPPSLVEPLLALGAPVVPYGGGQRVIVTRGAPGARVDLYGATLPSTTYTRLRTATLDAPGAASWTLAPRAHTRLYAVVRGVRSDVATLRVTRAVTVGVRQASGVYRFSGTVGPAVGGLQVTLGTILPGGRPVGIASTRTDRSGRYTIWTRLSPGTSMYFVVSAPTPHLLGGRSRLYGVAVPRA